MNGKRAVVAGVVLVVLVGSLVTVGSEVDDDRPQETKTQAADTPKAVRTRSGLLALYTFEATSGPIRDRSGVGKPVDLKIADKGAVVRSPGRLEIRSKAQVRSDGPAAKIIETVRRTGEMTLEVWLEPSRLNQEGPARIVTLSRSSNERNFTLGHDKDRYDVRFRATSTSANGIPSTPSPRQTVKAELTHLVFTRDRTGRVRIYLNGKSSVQRNVAGDTLNWHGQFRLALGNELNGSRPWLGSYRLVAIYGRDLLPHEVRRHFEAGPDAKTAAATSAAGLTAAERNFTDHVARVLARNCLECHDGATRKGGLDLSRKATALAGGESGRVIVPGKADDSLLWEMVAADEMPSDRKPLSKADKQVLRQWLNEGAVWAVDEIDPQVYAGDQRSGRIWVRRLTVPEYIETVRSAVGVDIRDEATRLLPADLRADGFANTAYNLNVDLKHVTAYSRLAGTIVEKMDLPAFVKRHVKCRKLDERCLRELIGSLGKRLLRGPLEELEVTSFLGVANAVVETGGKQPEVAGYVIRAMLQSPRFIYRIENQRGDGSPWPVGEYELASRLSYILWGGPPDDELMRAADRGELFDRDKVAAQVARMLKDPRAVEQSCRFVSQWLHLDRLNHLQPNAQRFPNWNPQLAQDMRAETLAFFREVAWKQRRPLTELFNSQVTFLSPRLARHYGMTPRGDGLRRYDLRSVAGRGGLLTHGSVLTVGGDEASMVARGLFVLKDVLRGSVKDPPPCVDTTPVPTKQGLTQRGIAEARIAKATCGGCHVKFEPLAFGLEKFDGIGAYHERDDHGNRLRDDGKLQFPGSSKSIAYRSSAELMNLLAASDRVKQCVTWKLAQFALGRPLVARDLPELKRIQRTGWKAGGTYADLITAVVMSDLVQLTRTETTE